MGFGSASSTGSGQEHDVDGATTSSTSPVSVSPMLSSEGRTRLLHRPSGLPPITDDEEVGAASPHPARFETRATSSKDVLANIQVRAVARVARAAGPGLSFPPAPTA